MRYSKSLYVHPLLCAVAGKWHKSMSASRAICNWEKIKLKKNQKMIHEKQSTFNLILKGVSATIAAVEKQ